MNIKSIVSYSVVALLLSTQAMARGGEGKGKGHFKELAKELNLTKEQMEKIKTHRKSMKSSSGSKEDRKAKREKRKQYKQDLKQAFINGESDSKIAEIHGKIQSLRSGNKERRIQKMIFMKNILNKEQRVKFMEIREKKRSERKSKRKGSN